MSDGGLTFLDITSSKMLAPFNAANIILQALESALALTPGGPVAKSFTANGQVAIDACCADPDSGVGGGMAWVTLARTYPTVNFPSQASGMVHCERLAAEYQIGVARCAPTPDPQQLSQDFSIPASVLSAAASESMAARQA
jgi:hypothetical protein